ncbi:MAG: biotin/lipoyl-containing protein, partial [Oceanobacter sp.]
PGGMLTNMENQLREQGASDKFDDVLKEIPRVREDLGFIPLVTPTSQIVGTQAVLNVLTGERYKSISKETQGILKGEYGAAPAPMNAELQAKVLDGKEPITCRPADLIENEMDKIIADVDALAAEKGFKLADEKIDDALTYALFPQIAPKFLENRGNPDAFEPAPKGEDEDTFTITVDGNEYVVQVDEGGDITKLGALNGAPTSLGGASAGAAAPAAAAGEGEDIGAPLAGNVWKVMVANGDVVEEGDVVMILEAMKMETEVRAPRAGTVTGVSASEGSAVKVGDTLYTLA